MRLPLTTLRRVGLFSLKHAHNANPKGVFLQTRGLIAQALLALLFFMPFQGLNASFDHGEFDRLLQDHVQWVEEPYRSCVDYENFNRDALSAYMTRLSALSVKEFESWNGQHQLAFLINAYNAFTIDFVLSSYPNLGSIRDLGNLFQSVWKKKRFSLFNAPTSLDDIEHAMIRASYNEPRIHAALVCAAVSCPPLQPHAYLGESLTKQLDDAFRDFIRGPHNTYVDYAKRLEISAIFRWYGEDFQPNVRQYLSVYTKEFMSNSNAIIEAQVRYMDYDWALNRCY